MAEQDQGSWDMSRGASPGEGETRVALPPGLARALGDRFELLGELGRGGMGVVLRARERATGRMVALKLVLEGGNDRVRRERFLREGELAARLDHTGIVRVHAAGETGGVPWLCCELVDDARGLDQVLPGLPLRARVALVRDLARALGHAHARGVIHRDVKPSNVLVGPDGRPRLTDFGLAAANSHERLTRTGVLLGTPYYMAPEQIASQRAEIGPHSDVWALGVILYQALCGRLPFQGETLMQLASAICDGEPPPPRSLDPSIPPAFEAVCLRALAKEPGQRPPDAQALAQELDRCLQGRRVLGPARDWLRLRWAPLLAAAALLPLATGLVLLGRHAAEPASPAGEEAPWRGLRWDGAPPATTTGAEGVALRLLVEPPDAWVEATREGWRARARAEGGRCEVWVPLETGANRIDLRLAGHEAASGLTLQLTREAVPAWFRDLPAARRPPALPAGVTCQARAGEYLNRRDGQTLVWIPPARAHLGSADAGTGTTQPERMVEFARGFFLGKHEVTWSQWRAWCAETGREPPDPLLEGDYRRRDIDPRETVDWEPVRAGDDHPVFRVTWDEARAYCAWAGGRLPSEEEWEYAARGSDGRPYPWGDREDDAAQRLNKEGSDDGFAGTSPVGHYGEKGASPFGCQDMAGGVFEWTEDRFVAPTDEGESERRVVRGGAWNCVLYMCRTYWRDGARPDKGYPGYGLRLCRSPE